MKKKLFKIEVTIINVMILVYDYNRRWRFSVVVAHTTVMVLDALMLEDFSYETRLRITEKSKKKVNNILKKKTN